MFLSIKPMHKLGEARFGFVTTEKGCNLFYRGSHFSLGGSQTFQIMELMCEDKIEVAFEKSNSTGDNTELLLFPTGRKGAYFVFQLPLCNFWAFSYSPFAANGGGVMPITLTTSHAEAGEFIFDRSCINQPYSYNGSYSENYGHKCYRIFLVEFRT